MTKYLLIALAFLFFIIAISFLVNVKDETVVLESPGEKNMVKNGVDFSDGKSVDVIDYEDHYLLVKDLRVGEAHPAHATGPGCPEKHWHAGNPVTAVNDGSVQSDPLSGGCGFGTLEQRPVMNYFPNELLAE